jgi:cellulose synthase/poly-beta-1,6-N-acetylglucosamine synthase-like glycosyltransferase
VLLPVFNGEATLAACLRSIARQTEPDWECVLVDDGSSDGSLACARRFAATDRRFRVVGSRRAGLVETLNAGLARCRGRFVARMDADDLMHRARLREQVAALEAHPDLAAVGCHVRLFPRGALAQGMRAYERWLRSIDSPRRVREEAFVECPLAHPTLMVRREVLQALRYRQCGWPEDYDLVLRLLEGGEHLSVVPRRLLCWRHGPDRLSHTSPVYSIASFTACKACFLARGFLSARESYVLWGYGATGKALRAALCEHGKRPSAIVELHPGRIGTEIHGAPVIHPEELESRPLQPLVVSVAGAAARGEIRSALTALGYRELRDFVCAA